METRSMNYRITQYMNLRREIAMLEERISSADTQGEGIQTDVVVGSLDEYPYTQHPITIKGYGSRNIPRLIERKAAHEAECDAIERYIETVEDSLMRQILTRRYLEGRTLRETARLVGYSSKHISRLIEIFFEKMSPNVS